jgi:hypothetical protein
LSRDTGTVIISNQLYKFKLEFWLSHIQLNWEKLDSQFHTAKKAW